MPGLFAERRAFFFFPVPRQDEGLGAEFAEAPQKGGGEGLPPSLSFAVKRP